MSRDQQRIDQITGRLKQKWGISEDEIRVVCSPLRICPLGAHIDHQLGLVTGMTIDRNILLAFAPNREGKVWISSTTFSPPVEFSLDDVPARVPGDWGNYVRGAVVALQQEHDLQYGIYGLVSGDMPIGGLSSSAAVGVAYLLALEQANDLEVTPLENVRLDQYIENVYLGLNNGILDQSIILLSDEKHLTYLDCRSVEVQMIDSPFQQNDFEIVVVHSGINEVLVGTDYNRRVAECQEAARLMLEWAGYDVPDSSTILRRCSGQGSGPSSLALRLVPEEVYHTYGRRLPKKLGKRATHFFTEMQRVQEGVAAWRKGDLDALGQLISASGASSINNYECGSEHLITIYEILNACPGVYGARFSGAGFRGCCIGLINPAYKGDIVEAIQRRYPQAHPDIADKYGVYFCHPAGKATVL
ncbi:MAG: galactokinase family protein [Anaerolineae bacterium]